MSVAAPITLKIITCFALKKFVENRRPWPLLLRISLPTSKFLLRDDVQRYVAIASLGCRVPSGNAGVSSLRSPCRFLEVTCSSNPFFSFICRNFKVLACADLSSFCRCVRKISSKKKILPALYLPRFSLWREMVDEFFPSNLVMKFLLSCRRFVFLFSPASHFDTFQNFFSAHYFDHLCENFRRRPLFFFTKKLAGS